NGKSMSWKALSADRSSGGGRTFIAPLVCCANGCGFLLFLKYIIFKKYIYKSFQMDYDNGIRCKF
ncbi:hypothetical protein, partial [Geobacillus stearothermophilus]|uniref:hypothetical protein n=1 Tax=Geobacillus stearothermophilus TaxID=1422 RepID=UPI0039EF7787